MPIKKQGGREILILAKTIAKEYNIPLEAVLKAIKEDTPIAIVPSLKKQSFPKPTK